MSFDSKHIDIPIKRVLHIGADRGGEIHEYHKMGVEEVVWVEANPDLFEELNIALRRARINDQIEIENKCFLQLISDVDDEELPFNIYYGSDAQFMSGNKGMSSLLTAQEDWWGAKGFQKQIMLNSLRVDTFLERNELGYDFDMLNIDTQGAEYRIFQGAVKLFEHVKVINTEVTFDSYQYEDNPLFEQIEAYLKVWGYHCEHIEYSDKKRWGDAIFAK